MLRVIRQIRIGSDSFSRNRPAGRMGDDLAEPECADSCEPGRDRDAERTDDFGGRSENWKREGDRAGGDEDRVIIKGVDEIKTEVKSR